MRKNLLPGTRKVMESLGVRAKMFFTGSQGPRRIVASSRVQTPGAMASEKVKVPSRLIDLIFKFCPEMGKQMITAANKRSKRSLPLRKATVDIAAKDNPDL